MLDVDNRARVAIVLGPMQSYRSLEFLMSSPPTSVTGQGVRLVFDSTRFESTTLSLESWHIAGYWADGSRN